VCRSSGDLGDGGDIEDSSYVAVFGICTTVNVRDRSTFLENAERDEIIRV
jgi:hypothetical protein